MKILIVGFGSIGKQHFKRLSNHDLFVWHHTEPFPVGEYDAALVCTPTQYHIKTALKLIGYGIKNIWIEKPIDVTDSKLDYLLESSTKNNTTVYIAYPLRHHPQIQKLKNRIKDHNIRYVNIECRSDARKWPTCRKTKVGGGGAVMELSHEIDLAEYLFGEIVEITGNMGRIGGVTEDAEDWARLKLLHANGDCSQVILDIGSGFEMRRVSFDIDGEFIGLDYKPTDEMWQAQYQYFFDNFGNVKLTNNIHDAGMLFRKILGFRNG